MSSYNFLIDVNLNKCEIQNAIIQNLSNIPSSPKKGQFYYNTLDNMVYIYDGIGWNNVLNRELENEIENIKTIIGDIEMFLINLNSGS